MSQKRLFIQADKLVTHSIAAALDPILEDEATTSVLFETVQDNNIWCYSIYVNDEETDEKVRWFAGELKQRGYNLEIEREELDDRNWVMETLRALSPVKSGRFLVHGSHDRDAALLSPIAVEVDAGQAFGTGHHGTTAGCLDLFEMALREGSGLFGQPRRVMDIGTGSGVLAIAAAKALRVPVLATDIDPVATKVAQENCRINGVAAHVQCQTATGFSHPCFSSFGQADLLFANILARPLEGLARTMVQHLAPGAQIILSGLLPHQQARIVARYRAHGLLLGRAHIRDGWLSLLMRKP